MIISNNLIEIWLNFIINRITANRRAVEAKACVKKYFNEDSVDINLPSLIRGIKDNKLISKPIQVPNHELDEIEITVPMTRILKNIVFDELFIIKKKRIETFIIRV